MNINRSNYEIYFLDYLDGNLPDDQIDDFLDFFEKNPDLNDELKSVSSIKLPKISYVFQEKEALKKNELTGSSIFDYHAVAFMEGDLEEEDQSLFLAQIANNREKERQFDQFLKTKLQPDVGVVFTDKERLYKKPAKKVFLIWVGRAAAAILLLIGTWTFLNIQQGHHPADHPIQNPTVASRPQLITPEEKQFSEQNIESKIENSVPSADTKSLAVVDPNVAKQLKKSDKSTLKMEEIAIVHREKAPPLIAPLAAELGMPMVGEGNSLMAMRKRTREKQSNYLSVDEYLAQKVLRQKPGESVSLSGVLDAGLEAVSNVSNDRVFYETDQQGKISKISVNTRLLAFSIPFRKR